MRKFSLLLLLLMLQLAMYGRGDKTPSLSQGTLSFIENKGQIRDQHGNPRSDIDFILRTNGMVLYIGKGQLHYQFIKENPKDTTHYTRENPPKHYQAGTGYTTYRLDVSLEGANTSAEALKEGTQTAQYHYYTNNTPEGITGVQSYNKITYKDIYPGIDWVLYTRDGKLKYDFVAHSGARISDIKLDYAGASAMLVAKDGSLQITTPLGNLEEDAPYSYEQGTNKSVTSHYLLNGNTVSIAAGAYKGTLVIDPGVDWATYFGGDMGESGQAVACDAAGNVYITGLTNSITGMATTGAHQTVFSGTSNDAFLAKFDSTGQLQWATYYGGTATSGFYITTQGLAVGCDSFGHVYMAGVTSVENGIATPGSFQEERGQNSFVQGFLAQFNSNGTRNWGTYYGGSLTDPVLFANATFAYSLACDHLGNVYIGGQTDSTSSADPLLTTTGSWQPVYGGGSADGWLAKFDSSGSRQWATYYGGDQLDVIFAIACDDSNNVYIAGGSNSPSGIATPGTLESTLGPDAGGFVAKLNSDGVRQWGTYIHGGWAGASLALDGFDHIYVSATTQTGYADTFIYTPGCYQSLVELNSQWNAFLIQFNTQNGTRNWGTFYGADHPTFSNSIACDPTGNVYMTGYTSSYSELTTSTIATPGSHQDTLNAPPGLNPPPDDGFIVQFDSAGVRKWASYYGGEAVDYGNGLAVDPSGAVYLVGQTGSTTAIATANSHQDTLNGSEDAFLVRWLPVDIGMERETPAADTVCTGDVPLTVLVTNHGRIDKTDDLVITYTFTGPSEGGDTLTFTDDLAAGAAESYSLGAAALDYEGTYDFTVYLHYTRDDNERNNDTLHFSLTTTTAEPVANIEYSQIGTNYQFSNPDGLSSYTYHWDFGDGDTSNEATPTHSYVADGTYDVTLIVTGWCGSDTAHLSLDAVGTGTAVSGISNDNLLTVYPNPAKGDLYIKAAGLTMKRYEVVNALGQTMLNGTLNGQQDKINVSGLAAGSYYIRIETNKGMAEKPFQVIR